ncbi:MAG: chemotaxis protein CheW [Deltaproteobacteria bacterium]|nr:chemotaxis protein CheW [Deltaproteobacteria bacterium]
MRVLAFFLDGEEYALDVADIVEVLRPRPVTEVPAQPGFIMGILCVNGEMIPVFDLRARLGLKGDARPYGRIIVAAADEQKAGLAVDGLLGVKEPPLRLFVPISQSEAGLNRGFFKGTFMDEGWNIRLLSASGIIRLS